MTNSTNLNKNCHGCGIELQNTDKEHLGYTPKLLEDGENILCQRCFRIRYYQEINPVIMEKNEYMTLIETIFNEDVFSVMVIDLFDLESSLLPQFSRLLNQKDFIVIANKRDLLPKSIIDARLRSRIMKTLHKNGLKPQDVIIASALKNRSIDQIITTIDHFSKGRRSYLIGMSNVGKSSLINAFIRASTGVDDTPITVSKTPGTTLNPIPIPFESTTLYDTPGLFATNHISHILTPKSYTQIQPQKEIKPTNFQLESKQTLFLAGLARLDYINGGSAVFVIYTANDLAIHRCKLEKADQVYQNMLYKELSPPHLSDSPFTFTKTQYHLKGKNDIVIPGLGFVSIIGNGTVHVHTPKGVNPYQREALIG